MHSCSAALTPGRCRLANGSDYSRNTSWNLRMSQVAIDVVNAEPVQSWQGRASERREARGALELALKPSTAR